ncbi:hypothetical protein LEP1GSC150_4089 [Leptospira interrogans serovar Copenhageni str. LT2050]|uniref:Uncharacterized protein n=1 Tax=Leptospira interrogans serovar Copenhageni str. LT2050 TaxID=1001598 RepID=M3I031_LEPIT|nr:hypothetical protein LEP1GSC150_4089 [Leptospira interrogans serovar Copenhageni str. LT2050]
MIFSFLYVQRVRSDFNGRFCTKSGKEFFLNRTRVLSDGSAISFHLRRYSICIYTTGNTKYDQS